MDSKQDTEKRLIEGAKREFGGMLTKAIELSKGIKDEASFREASEYLLVIKARLKWWFSWNKPIKQKIDELKKAALSQEQLVAEPMQRAEMEWLKPNIDSWIRGQNEIRRQKEEKIQFEIRKRQEDERLARAAELEAQGKSKQADVLLDQPIPKPAVTLPDNTKMKGIKSTVNWRFRIVDESLIPREYMVVDGPKIGGVVRAMKDKTQIPGVEAYPESGISAGGSR